MAGDLEGKRALVCGSTKGIGRACAIEFARRGAEVVIAARDEAALEALRKELPAPGGQAHTWVAADFKDSAALAAKVEGALSARGPIHVLLNNTGGPPPGPVLEATVDQFLDAFRQHLFANHLLARLVVPGMKSARWGRIVNVVSTSVREPIAGLGVSNTVRAAVAGWAKTLSREVAPFGITVNNVLPGATRTDRMTSLMKTWSEKKGVSVADYEREVVEKIPAGRMAGPEEIAAAAAFLASPAAAYVNGVSLPVDGGRLAGL